MKRILSLFFVFVLLFGLTACGEAGGGESLGSSDSGAGETDLVTTDSNSSKEELPADVFDPSKEHKFLACDIINGSIVVFDLNACEGDYQKLTDDDLSVVWEFSADEHPECNMLQAKWGVSSAKYRYSEYYERDVIVACSSSGWAAVIDYETEELLWESYIASGPHSVEMIPNGDVVVACSSVPGALVYVPLSAGIETPVSSIESIYCHGVSWDPENEWLWVLEDTGVYAAGIQDMGTKDAKIFRMTGTGDLMGTDGNGHAFSPVYGNPGKYWVSSHSKLWIFDSATEKLTDQVPQSYLNSPFIKGICNFPDGTAVVAINNLGGKATISYGCDGFRVVTKEMTSGKIKKKKTNVVEVLFEPGTREFYKVQPFTKDYQ